MIIFAALAATPNPIDELVIAEDPFVKLEKSIILVVYLHDVNSIFLGKRLSISMKKLGKFINDTLQQSNYSG